jgi:hypothetical protein
VGGACGVLGGGERNMLVRLVRKSEGKRLTGRTWRSWESSRKSIIHKCNRGTWIGIIWLRIGKLRFAANVVLKFRGCLKYGKFLRCQIIMENCALCSQLVGRLIGWLVIWLADYSVS